MPIMTSSIRASIAVALAFAGLVALTEGAAAQSASPAPGRARSAAPVEGTATPPGPTPMTGASAPLGSDYVIGPGDLLQVTVWKNDTLSRVVPVRPDGKISLPLLQDISAA